MDILFLMCEWLKYLFFSPSGERGQCVLDTPPKILFCDLRLDPGESKTCMFKYVGNHFNTGGFLRQIQIAESNTVREKKHI